jgi:DNA-directed RNA polymerase specialized sigma24 family protein
MMDARQLADLLDAHSPALMLLARQYVSAPEDAVQEAFVKLSALTLPPDDVRAWLFRVV